MQTIKFRDFELSRLMLGTAQLGLDYGIANTTGQPSYEAARAMLACALEGGANCLDTAAAYGESEEVIGRALADLGIADKVVVVTKINRDMADHYPSSKAVDDFVEASVTSSLSRLRLDVLPICLFHGEQQFRYVDSLLKLKERGLVRHIGSSLATPAGASSVLSSGLAEAVQLPTNILDKRFTLAGILRDARARGTAVFVRSIYLQGLIVMPEEDVPSELAEVIPVRRKLERLASDAGMSLVELSVRYVLSLEGTTCGVAGMESVEQVKDNLKLFSKGPLAPDLMEAVVQAVPDLPEKILMPFFWGPLGGERPPRRPRSS